ncbi:MAG TPA: hypothetical protein VFL64_12205 [Rhizobacter sp.]|nr:hypothetical protein [Rhizobacter sp.]
MDGILSTLRHLSFAQMICAWLFVGCYALAVGGMLGGTGSLRSGVVAAVSGVLFAAFSDEWVHGALLILFAVAGMGLFVVVAWLLARGSAWLIAQGAVPPQPRPILLQKQPLPPAPVQPTLLEGLRAWARSLHLSP